ncbi:FkbM family methyltransferase [Nostoc commune]|uniref:FkbM family methyltransferase n=1 Tax=Nostoc commune TaxID=1178 RepID=UPI0018C85396|nr:FkbM family methyltransferase [Nostoc commune]MBG1260299.1 FkbM family methyltransferase [Nostoc commune BAE]
MIAFKFSNIRSNNPIGKFLRLPLSLLPTKSILPILQGPAKGMKWIIGSGVHGMWLGSYEEDKQKLLTELSLEGTTVLDIGANVGFFSILLSRLVGVTGKVISFEPLPRNIEFIRQHIRLNKIDNIEIISAAVSDKIGKIKFATSHLHAQGYLTDKGDLEVSIITLDSLDNLNNPVSLVKIDVEGAEANVLRGGEKFFQEYRPIILLATHGKNQVNDCQVILHKYNYSMALINKDLYGLGCDEWLAKPHKFSL